MSQSDHIEIIKLCLTLDAAACKFYRQLSADSGDKTLQDFWDTMMRQEEQHVRYWKDLAHFAEKNTVPAVFDNPREIKIQLQGICEKVQSLLKGDFKVDVETAFFMAYQVEFYLMHPAFEALFLFMRKHTGDASPSDSYQDHIAYILKGLRQMGKVKPVFELIAQMMDRLWQAHQKLALQLSDIQALRSLVPICMHCKKVRDDDGFWGQVESYVTDHFHADFSHGICPDCLEKYYPEYKDEKEG